MYLTPNGPQTHQVVQFRVLAEERVPLLLLTADEVLDVDVEAGGGDAVGAERGLLTLLKEQRQQREQRMSAPTNTAFLQHTQQAQDKAEAGHPGNLYWGRRYSRTHQSPTHIASLSSPLRNTSCVL